MRYITEADLKRKVKKALRALVSEEDIKNYTHIDYGIYDQPHLSGEEDPNRDDEQEETDAVMPSPEASLQLTTTVPDVGNPEYMPTSLKELQIAVFTIAEQVPETQFRDFYRGVMDLLTQLIDKASDETQEIKEATDLPHSYRKEKPTPGNYSLQQTADAVGIKSVAKMAQFENRLLKKMRSLLLTSKSPDIDALLEASLDAYMSVMKDAGIMSDSDVQNFQARKSRQDQLKDSELFKSFIGNAILQQGVRKIRLATEKALRAEIEKIDIPKGADLTILNHVMDNTNMTYQRFVDLIGEKAAASDYDMDKLFDLSRNMPSILQNLRDTIEDLENTKLIPLALKEWIDSSEAKKIKLLKKAVHDLQDTYDAPGVV